MADTTSTAETLARLIVAHRASVEVRGGVVTIRTPDGGSASIPTNQPVMEDESSVVNR